MTPAQSWQALKDRAAEEGEQSAQRVFDKHIKGQLGIDWDRLRNRAALPMRGKRREQAKRELRAWVHSQLAHELGAQQSLMFVPVGSPVPPGWKLVEGRHLGHHFAWSQMVERCER